MDLEQQLEQLNEQTNSAKNSLWIEQRSFISDAENVSRQLGFDIVAVLSIFVWQAGSLIPFLWITSQ